MRITWLGWLAGSLMAGCVSSLDPDRAPTIPDWLQARIEGLARDPVSDPPASVIQYSYRRQTVYYFPPRQHCCDFASELFGAAGRRLCSPDGGITGAGDGGCPDFAARARRVRLVWVDPRVP